MSKAVINTRNLSSTLSGVQRYTIKLLDRLQGKLCPIAPHRPLHGFLGHAWEQMILPVRLKGNLLFSPSNTGPLMVKRQVVTIYDITPSKSFEEIDQVKDALGIADFRYIITVATSEPRKNLQRLLEAWSTV